MSGLTRALALPGGLLLVAVLLAASAVYVAARPPTGPLAAERNVRVNRAGPLDAANSPSLARNPRDPKSLALTHRVDRPAFSAVLEWSTDGGHAWRPTPLPLPPGLDRPFAPDVAFGPDGRLYVSYVNLAGIGNTPDSLWVASSSDRGRSLSPPVRVTAALPFQARVAVGPDSTVYVTWLQVKEIGIFSLTQPGNPVVVSRSTDGGRTFSPPVPASDPARPRVGAATPVVDADGHLLVLYEDFKGDRRDFELLDGPPWEQPFALVLTRSTDGGRSFSPGVEVDSDVRATRRFVVFLPEFPSIATGPDHRVYVAWADGRSGDADVLLRRSDDGGSTWSAPVRVNDDPQAVPTSQYLPRVAVAPSGRVDVVFLDRRRDRGDVRTDAFMASSDDEGRSFRNVRLSSTSFDSRVGPVPDDKVGVDFGSRLGISSTDRSTVAAWTDTRRGSDENGRQDVEAAVVRIQAQSRPWATAALLGLTAAVAAVGAIMTGRMARPAPPGEGRAA